MCVWYTRTVDAIRRHDIEWVRRTAPGVKLAQALQMMRFGIDLKRSSIRSKHPQASEAEIQQMLQAWLESDG